MIQEIDVSPNQWPITLMKCVVAATAFACLAMTFVVAKNEQEFVVSLLGIVSLCVVSIPLFMRAKISVFEPITFMILLVLIGSPIKLIYILWVRNTDEYVAEHVLLNQPPEVFLAGSVVILAGYAMFVLGYMLRLPTLPLSFVFLPEIREWNGKRLQITIAVIGVVCVVCFIGFILVAGVRFSSLTEISQKRFLEQRAEGGERMHSAAYLFCRGAAFSKFLVYFCLVWIIYRKKSFWSGTGLILALAILQSILLAIVINSRAGVALLLLDCAVLSYYLFRRVDFRMIGACFAVALIIMIPMLAARGQRQEGNINTSIGRLFQKTLSGRNMLDISKCCHIINGVPKKLPYRDGEMLYAWLAAPIPTSYWPDKPRWANQGVVVNQRIFGYRGNLSGCPPSLIGELCWNFGKSGIWVGLFIAGLVYRQIFLAFYPHRHNPTSILIYTMIVTRFVLFSLGNDLGTGIVKAGLDLVPVCLILCFIGMYQVPKPVTEKVGRLTVRPGSPVERQLEAAT